MTERISENLALKVHAEGILAESLGDGHGYEVEAQEMGDDLYRCVVCLARPGFESLEPESFDVVRWPDDPRSPTHVIIPLLRATTTLAGRALRQLGH